MADGTAVGYNLAVAASWKFRRGQGPRLQRPCGHPGTVCIGAQDRFRSLLSRMGRAVR